MADTKISAMPAATTLDGSEVVPLVQAGGNVQDTVTNIVTETIAVNPGSYRTTLGLGTMATQNANNVSITGGSIFGTTVAGYVPTSRTITAGTGLTGGGDLSVNRTLAMANTGVTAATYGASTKIPVLAINAQGQVTTASEITLSASSLDLVYGQFLQDGETELTAPMSNNSVDPIQVTSTTNFQAPGYLIVGQEVVAYTGVTATTFTGITRGVKGTTNTSHNISDKVTEAAAVANGSTSQSIGLDITVYNNKVSVESNNEITFETTGVYNVQFSLQFLNYTTSDDNVTVWFKKNGSDIAYSASVQLVPPKHGSSPGATILALNSLVDAVPDDYIQIQWTSDSGNTVLGTFPSGTSPVHPTSPAAIVTVTQVG